MSRHSVMQCWDISGKDCEVQHYVNGFSTPSCLKFFLQKKLRFVLLHTTRGWRFRHIIDLQILTPVWQRISVLDQRLIMQGQRSGRTLIWTSWKFSRCPLVTESSLSLRPQTIGPRPGLLAVLRSVMSVPGRFLMWWLWGWWYRGEPSVEAAQNHRTFPPNFRIPSELSLALFAQIY